MTPSDANVLMNESRCYRCIPNGMRRALEIWQLDQWNQNKPPGVVINWLPETEQAVWHDAGGNHTGDLATFLATADMDTVDTFDMSGSGAVTQITGLQSLTALGTLVMDNNLIAQLDVSNMPTLTSISAVFCQNLNSLILTGDEATLQTLILASCNFGPVFDVSGFTSLLYLDITNNPLLTDVDCSGDTSLNTFDCSGANLVDNIVLTGCTALAYFGAGFTSLAGYDFTSFANIDTINLYGCALLTDFDLTNRLLLTTLYCGATAIGGLPTGTPTCSALVTLLIDSNAGLVTADLSSNTSLVYVDIYDCSLTTLDVTGLVSLETMDCSGNAGLTSITGDNGLTVLTNIYCNNCNIDSLDLSGSPSVNNITASNNGMRFLKTNFTNGLGVYVDISFNDIPNRPPVGVDDLNQTLVNLAATCIPNAGTFDSTAGTNAAPSAGPPDGATAKANLIGGGWTVNTN